MSERPSKSWAVLGGLVAVLVAGLVAVLVGRAGSDRAAERRTVKAYADVISPLAYEGGSIVQQEIKPRLAALQAGRVTPEQFRVEAQRWIRDFGRIRYGFRNAPHPAGLAEAARLYDESLSGYIRAVQKFIDASKLKGKALEDAVHNAVPTAEEADKTYDRARAALNRELKRLGLPESQ